MSLHFSEFSPHDARDRSHHHILNETNCSLHPIDEFPDWFPDEPTRLDYVAYCSLITFYLFLAIAILCEEFCVPAVEKICYDLNMSFNVAGATFMAVATSSPEFFTNLYSTFLTEGDIGLGTIVGSSVFNTLAITALCCLFSGVSFSIDWWPITRDIIWYMVAVSALTLMLWDGHILWWEALILLLLYALNIINLLLDENCQNNFRDKTKRCKLRCFRPRSSVKDFEKMADPNDSEEEPYNFSQLPEGFCSKFMWLISLPWECLFFVTIPNVKRQNFREWSLTCLVMSMLWMAFLTYFCTFTLTVIGYHLFIPNSLMGLVFLAIGTSVPEAVSSIIVTKKGYGSMSITNAIGSNTVDILLCLGAPWLLKSLLFSSSTVYSHAVDIVSKGLAYSSGCILISVLVMYIAFMCVRFRLGPALGFICLITYLIFIAIAVTIEMLFFDPLPHCKHEKGYGH